MSNSDTFFQDINKKKKEKKNFRYYMLNSAYICETICRHSRYAHCLMEKGFVVEISSKWGCNAPPFPYPSMHSNISRQRKYKRITYQSCVNLRINNIDEIQMNIVFSLIFQKLIEEVKFLYILWIWSRLHYSFQISYWSGAFLWNFILIFIKREAYWDDSLSKRFAALVTLWESLCDSSKEIYASRITRDKKFGWFEKNS